MPDMGGWEWVILGIVALLLFGGSRLADIGKNAGKAIREFKEETSTKPDAELARSVLTPAPAPDSAPTPDPVPVVNAGVESGTRDA